MKSYENAIAIKGVTKRYDGFTLDNISFDVPKGCIMGFIGQNGAGKTTTIRSLLHITDIDSGEISLLGMDHVKDEAELKKRIAVVFYKIGASLGHALVELCALADVRSLVLRDERQVVGKVLHLGGLLHMSGEIGFYKSAYHGVVIGI